MIQEISRRLRKIGHPNSEDGFTFIEALVSITLVAIFFGGVIGLVIQGFNLFAYNRVNARLNREGNNVLDRLEALIRGCRQINDGAMGSNYSRVFDFQSEIDGDEEKTGNWVWDSELGRTVNIGEEVTISRDSTTSPEIKVRLRYMERTGTPPGYQYESKDVTTEITRMLDTQDANALQFTYYRYDETGSLTEEVTSDFNNLVGTVKVSAKLALTTGGASKTRIFSRYVKLRIDR